jgi:hypothetical protein
MKIAIKKARCEICGRISNVFYRVEYLGSGVCSWKVERMDPTHAICRASAELAIQSVLNSKHNPQRKNEH